MEKKYDYNQQMDVKYDYQGVCVPKGTMHRPVAKEKAVVLMMENIGIDPIGND